VNVAILGTGYVGLTTGACLAFLGHKVTCVDSDPEKIKALERGEVPFYEPYLAELIADAQPNLSFTVDYAAAVPSAQVIFIAVGTPPGLKGAPDLRYLQAAARGVGEHLGPHFTVIVNKSTVPIGSGNWVGSLVREVQRDGPGNGSVHGPAHTPGKPSTNRGCFAVASNPEFLREGSAIHDSLYPDRVVIGADEVQTAEVLISTDLASAELIKYAANAFLSLKISYINEIGQLAERVGADISQVARGIGLDARIGTRFLQAGVGWGGSCFGKDTAALIATAASASAWWRNCKRS
jgi:UDPglucose 6-dehydrogenase